MKGEFGDFDNCISAAKATTTQKAIGEFSSCQFALLPTLIND
jgi:hypothetical protein